MKRFLKVFSLVFVLALTIALFAISVSAASEVYTVAFDFGGNITETRVTELPEYSVGDYVEYKDGDFRASYKAVAVSKSGSTLNVKLDTEDLRYYSITTASGSVSYVTKSDIGSDLGAKFIADVNALKSGSTVQLLSDVLTTASSLEITNKTVYLDLNGFNLMSVNKACGTSTFVSVNTASFYLYSSRPGATLFHSAPAAKYTETQNEDGTVTGTITPGTPTPYSVFSLGAAAKLYLGAYDGHDGNNISIYGNMLVNAIGTYAEDEYAINIDGGYYNRYYSGKMAGMFYLRDSSFLTGHLNVSAKNATFNALARAFYCYSASDDPVGTKQFRIDVENCVFASGTAADMEPMYEGRMQANFKDCYFLSNPGSSDIVNLSDGCYFVSEYPKSLDEGSFFAKTVENKKINLKTTEFAFENYRYDADKNVIYADFDVSSLVVAEDDKIYYFSKATASEEISSVITWIDENGNATQEVWLNGSNPVPAKALPEGNDSYYYTYGKLVAVNGDRTYEARPVAKFGLKVNLTLSDDLFYNVYVPAAVIEDIKEVRVYNSLGEGVVLERSDRATINGVPYYRYYFNIQASKAADAFSFDMDIFTNGLSGEYFTQKNEMSIPSYAAPIIYNNEYSDATHNLMNKVLAYVKAACDYFKTSGENKYYSVIEKIPSVTAPTYRVGEELAALPEGSDVKSVINGISVIFGSQLKYRYYFKNDADFSANDVKISWVRNGNVSVATLTSDKLESDEYGRYYDIALRASDMRSDVILTVNSDSFTYKLSNYIFEVNEGSDENAKKLVYSLWDYSEAASKFNNETPDVDVSIDGTPIEEYKIVANTEAERDAAEAFKAVIAKEYNIELEILQEFEGKAIVFKTSPLDSSYDFLVSMIDDDLVIECAYRSFFKTATETYVNDVYCNLNRDLDISRTDTSVYKYEKILYSDFDVPTYNGSAQDFKGLTSDEINAIGAEDAFLALQYAHSIANKKGYDVYAEPGKVYYIRETLDAKTGKKATITIKTNTYWQGADFIIDDTDVSPNVNTELSGSHVFTLSSDYARVQLTALEEEIRAAGGFTKDIKKLNTGLGYPAMLLVNNASTRHFIRFSTSTGKPSSFDQNGNPAGQEQHEYVIVDADGNIDPKTGFLFDYNSVSSIYAYRIDDTPIVLDGGEGCTMTTLSSQVPLAPNEYKNISRNLYVSRCNSSVENIEHVIYNEPTDYGTSGAGKTSGHTYTGFFYTGIAYNVEFRDCVVQARNRCVEGTYDLGVYNALDVRFINVTQSNFYEEGREVPNTGKCWYVMGSNFCKNLTYDGCVLTRFDAHCGVYNATIKNSTISSIRLTGGGHFLMENTTVIARRSAEQGFIELREDYGSTWDGTLEIKDCTYKNAWGTSDNTLYLITAIWVNHNFGYQTYLPNVIVDNLKLAPGHGSIKNIEIFQLSNGSDLDNAVDTEPDFEEGLAIQDFRQSTLQHNNGKTKTNVNPYIAPKSIIIKNNFAGFNYKAPTHVVFENTSFKEWPLPFPDFDTPVIDVFR